MRIIIHAVTSRKRLSAYRDIRKGVCLSHPSRVARHLSLTLMLLCVFAPAIHAGEDAKKGLPEGVLLRLGSTDLQHHGSAIAVAFSADGNHVISAGREKTVRIWDARSGAQRARIDQQAGAVAALALEGDYLATATGGQVFLYQLGSGKRLWRAEASKSSLRSLAISPDKKWLAAGNSDDDIVLLGIADGKPVRTLRANAGWVSSLVFSPDSKTLLAGGQDFKVFGFDVASGNKLHELAGHGEWVWGIAGSPDGASIATASWDNTIGIWDTKTGKLAKRLTGHDGRVWCVAFSPDGNWLASGGDDNTLRIWHARTGKLHATVAHPWWVNAVAFSPDSKTIASAGEDNRIRLWLVDSAKPALRTPGHDGPVIGVAYLMKGRMLVCAGHDKTVRIWDAQTGKIRIMQAYDQPIASLAVHESLIASGSRDGTVHLLNPVTRTRVQKIRAHGDTVSALAFAPTGHLASGSYDRTIRVWHPDSGTLVRKLPGHEGWVTGLDFAEDGTLASSGTDGVVKLWGKASDKPAAVLEGHRGWVSDVAFAAETSLLASVGRDELARLWKGGKLLRVLDPRQNNPNDTTQVDLYTAAFSPDGKLLATAGEDATIRIWEADTGKLHAILRGHLGSIRKVAFLPSGNLISGSDDGTALVWRVK